MAKKTDEIEVAVAEVVDYLRIKGDFAPALAAVVERKVAAEGAKKMGIRVSGKELQKAADALRVLNDLSKARDTERWLKANGITVEALEGYLETNILLSKLKDRLEKKAPKTKYMKAPAIQESIREMAYRDWLAKEMK